MMSYKMSQANDAFATDDVFLKVARCYNVIFLKVWLLIYIFHLYIQP